MSTECSTGNIPPGYKQTEVGVIPEDWDTKPCSALSDLITVGIVIRPTQYYAKQGVPALRSANIREKGIDDVDMVFISEKANALLSKSQLRTGDVLTVRTGYPGTSAVVTPSFSGSNCIDILITRPSKAVSPTFISAWINSSFGKSQVLRNQGGLAQQHFNVSDLKNLVVALPSTKAEQESIAEAISDTDAFIESLEQLIAKKRQIKQGAMQELLTGKRRMPGFEEIKNGYEHTEVGMIPEDWIVKPIGDLVSISVGRDLREENYSTYQDDIFKYPVFSNTVTSEGLYGFYNIPEYDGESLTIVGRGVGLGTAFTRRGGFGAIGRLLVLFPEKNVNANFLTEYINHRVKIFTESGGIPQLTGVSIAKYRIPLPPTKAEQEAIASILSDMDSEITALEEKLAKARQIKQGMMQELLTGKIRLI